MVQTQKDVNRTDAVRRAHQLEFLVLRQVPEVNRAKSAERHVDADRHRVLGVVLSRLEARTIWIRAAGAWQRRLDRLASGRHDKDIQTRDRNPGARSRDAVPGFGVELRIRLLQKFVGGGTRLNIRAVIDEMADRNARREFRHAAKMIAVPVRGNQIVDLREACLFRGGHDALGVSDRAGAGVPRIDQDRFAGRRHKERGVSALHIDDIHIKRLRGSSLRGWRRRREREREQKRD